MTQKQIDALPQTTRNFLSFADLAPGRRFHDRQATARRKLRGGAQTSAAINVYIDGVGQKNYVLQGGITGQDSSRGNPFPQSAIAEYKVITQNYKAEFDQISSAAVTAVTKSGTNEFHGEAFWDHSSDGWRAPTPAEKTAGRQDRRRTKTSTASSLGGPIVQDRMHWFLAYEGKSIHTPRAVTVGQGRTVADLPTGVQGLVGSTERAVPRRPAVRQARLVASTTATCSSSPLKVRDEDEIANVGERNTAAMVDAEEERRDAARPALPAQQRQLGQRRPPHLRGRLHAAAGRARSHLATC